MTIDLTVLAFQKRDGLTPADARTQTKNCHASQTDKFGRKLAQTVYTGTDTHTHTAQANDCRSVTSQAHSTSSKSSWTDSNMNGGGGGETRQHDPTEAKMEKR